MEDVRYGNDLTLTDINRQIEAVDKSRVNHLRVGNLSSAFTTARLMQVKLDKFMARLNEIQPMPKLPDGYK